MGHQRRYDQRRMTDDRSRTRAADPADTRSLPTVVGNAAFTRLVQRTAERDDPASQGAGPLDPGIGAAIDEARGRGTPLPQAVGADMASQFGVDFSPVRVHTDDRADALSRSVQAAAFTVGTDVFFRQGSYQPSSPTGRHLLAHELTHVVQHSSGVGGDAGESRVSHPTDPAEVQAEAVARSVSAGSAADPAPAVEHAGGVDLDLLQAYGGNAAVARLLADHPLR